MNLVNELHRGYLGGRKMEVTLTTGSEKVKMRYKRVHNCYLYELTLK